MYLKVKKKGWGVQNVAALYSAAAGGGEAGAPFATYVTNSIISLAGANGTSSGWTSDEMNIGAESPSRRVIFCLEGGLGDPQIVSAGFTPTGGSRVALTAFSYIAQDNANTNIISGILPLGAAGILDATFNGNVYGGLLVQAFTVDNSMLLSAVPNTATANGSGSSFSSAVGVLPGGFVIGLVGFDNGLSRITTWASLARVYDSNVMSVALANSPGSSPVAETVTISSPSNGSMVLAAFR